MGRSPDPSRPAPSNTKLFGMMPVLRVQAGGWDRKVNALQGSESLWCLGFRGVRVLGFGFKGLGI